MANVSFAPVTEYYNVAAAATQIVGSGANFKVYAVYFSTDTAEQASVELQTLAGAVLFHFNIVAGGTASVEAPFIADAGLQIVATTSNVHTTVLRQHTGT